MKKTYPLKKCPWCKKTPQFSMYLRHGENEKFDSIPSEGTWTPHIRCENIDCTVQPNSKYVAIRNTSKVLEEEFWKRFDACVENWNTGLETLADTGLIIDYDEIVKDFDEN